jgi:hypothetical protein
METNFASLFKYLEKEISAGFIMDYTIARALSGIEKRVKNIEMHLELDYKKGVVRRQSVSPAEEYKMIELSTFDEFENQVNNWAKELQFFDSIKAQLLSDPLLTNRFVAIKDQKVIDHDIDKLMLARRINEKFAYQSVLIVKVQRSFPFAEVPSPEVPG